MLSIKSDLCHVLYILFCVFFFFFLLMSYLKMVKKINKKKKKKKKKKFENSKWLPFLGKGKVFENHLYNTTCAVCKKHQISEI